MVITYRRRQSPPGRSVQARLPIPNILLRKPSQVFRPPQRSWSWSRCLVNNVSSSMSVWSRDHLFCCFACLDLHIQTPRQLLRQVFSARAIHACIPGLGRQLGRHTCNHQSSSACRVDPVLWTACAEQYTFVHSRFKLASLGFTPLE